jgi:hypothetical protein
MQDLEKSEKAMHEKYTTVKVLPYHTMQYSLPYYTISSYHIPPYFALTRNKAMSLKRRCPD